MWRADTYWFDVAVVMTFLMYVLPGVMFGAILVVHGWSLPKKGVNGWTMEPRDQYYRIMGLHSSGRRGGRTTEG
jgi:hypothetical protein